MLQSITFFAGNHFWTDISDQSATYSSNSLDQNESN